LQYKPWLMKKLLLLSAFIFPAAMLQAQANTSNYKFNGEQAVFTENRGQVVDQDGKPVPDVLAKASMPGLDMYLTKTGVTYILLQYAEDLTAKPHPVFINDKKYKITYSRVDVAYRRCRLAKQLLQK
jgi:ribosomal protein S18 acetylase RimI-like enzyme